MIWERITSPWIRAIGYDPGTHAVTLEFAEGQDIQHTPVPYTVYHAIASARFPGRVYRHLLADRVLPAGVTIAEARGYRPGDTGRGAE